MSAPRRTSIGHYLLTRLRECGIDTVFGVPGDFNLTFLEQLTRTPKLRWVGNCNELNGAYAADGYARMKGAAALVVTYGVGDLSALNGLAGSFAERVPVICISGLPPLQAIRDRMIMHHTSGMGNLEDVMDCVRQFTVAQARLEPANAAIEIDRLLSTALRERRPVYLQFPCDIVNLEIDAPLSPLEVTQPRSDSKQLARAVGKVVERIKRSKSPMILVDGDAHRFGLRPWLCALGEALKIPFASLASGRTIFNEQHPLYSGIYAGEGSSPGVGEAVEHSDCLLGIGVRLFDITTGIFSHRIPEAHLVRIDPFVVSANGETFEGVVAAELLEELTKVFAPNSSPVSAHVPEQSPATSFAPAESQDPLSHVNLWPRIEAFLAKNDVIIAESGTVSAGIGGIRLPADCAFIHQTLWASIGYALPATLGAMMAEPSRRHLLFIGDGALQMTAQEISTLFRQKLKPIIFVVNNSGYTIERVIFGKRSEYNDIQNWNYRALPQVFSENAKLRTFKAATVGELDAVLKIAQQSDCFTLIELILDAFDAPQGLFRMGSRVAKFNYGLDEEARTELENRCNPGWS
jgi:indolepyruvate decarboxylase